MTKAGMTNEMVKLQERLNVLTNGEEWISGINNSGKTINWCRCIWMECAELANSFPWKHWKDVDAEIDEKNVEIELVDIWHFVISLLLELNGGDIKKTVNDIDGTLLRMIQVGGLSLSTQDERVSAVEKIVGCVTDGGPITRKEYDFNGIERLLHAFFHACYANGLSYRRLYDLYIGKNALNEFRQTNGYKNGTYRKIWENGKEDNVALGEILERKARENIAISYDGLLEELELAYMASPRSTQ